jgi:hypothetical protein
VNRHVAEEIRGPRYCPSIESKAIRYVCTRLQVWKLIVPYYEACTTKTRLFTAVAM